MSNSTCRQRLAAHVDSFIYEQTFIPFEVKVRKKPNSTPPPDAAILGGLLHSATLYMSSAAIQEEFEEYTADNMDAYFELNIKDMNKWTSRIIRKKVIESMQLMKEEAAAELSMARLADITEKLEKKADSIVGAKADIDGLESLIRITKKRGNLFVGSWNPKNRERAGRRKDVMAKDIPLGVLFADRVRIRPIGWTIERAPFHELSLTAGEVVTVTQRSFSKRTVSLEEAAETEKTSRTEFSSSFSNSLQEEFARSYSRTHNTGANASFGVEKGPVKLGGGAQTSTVVANTQTESTSSIKSRETARRVESELKASHRTVVSHGSEITEEADSTRVITNTERVVKKLLFRRLMAVHHCSYERWGASLCWTPCIDDPGRDVRDFVPGELAFPEEKERIRAAFADQFPSAQEVPPISGSERREFTDDVPIEMERGFLSPNLRVGSGRITYEVPAGYEVVSTEVALSYGVISNEVVPRAGATGEVTIQVDVFTGTRDVDVSFRAEITLRQSPAAYDAAVAAWREKQVDAEFKSFLTERQEDLSLMDNPTWPESELWRRIVERLFGSQPSVDCRLVQRLERLFEWESLAYRLHAPWWRGESPDDLPSLRVTFFNASYATAFIPIRKGQEVEALVFLASLGALECDATDEGFVSSLHGHLADFEKYSKRFESRFDEPAKIPQPEQEAALVAAAGDVLLTEKDTAAWDNYFESERKFDVLDRYVVATPTDGVDIEEFAPECDTRFARKDHLDRMDVKDALLRDEVIKAVQADPSRVSVSIEGDSS